jgi:hypothetical protein
VNGYKPRASCGLCRGSSLRTVLSFPDTPLANEFQAPPGSRQDMFPLRLVICESCKHVQIGDLVSGERLFREYLYATSTSAVTVAHFRDYAKEIFDRHGLEDRQAFVVEVGSNDGTMLSAFKGLGVARVLGVDPAVAIAKKATEDGLPTLASFFDVAVAKQIVSEHGHADVVVANNVLAHAEDLATMLDGVEVLLAPDGLFVFEVSYLMDIFDHGAFDTIYHEHFSYHTLSPLLTALGARGLAIYDVLLPTGQIGRGSIRIYAQRAHNEIVKGRGGGKHTDQAAMARMVERESAVVEQDGPWRQLEQEIDRRGRRLNELLAEARGAGASVCGYGAPAKLTTLTHAFKTNMDGIDFVIEDAPLKIGRLTPGTHRPIVSSKAVPKDPSHCVLFAWNFGDSIVEKWRRGGVTGTDGGLIPLPQFINPMRL